MERLLGAKLTRHSIDTFCYAQTLLRYCQRIAPLTDTNRIQNGCKRRLQISVVDIDPTRSFVYRDGSGRQTVLRKRRSIELFPGFVERQSENDRNSGQGQRPFAATSDGTFSAAEFGLFMDCCDLASCPPRSPTTAR